MSKPFRALIFGKDDRSLLQIHGVINETSDFDPIRISPEKTLEIDFSNVVGINSIGLRNLRAWSHTLQNKKIVLTFCPRVIIDQINMIKNLFPTCARVSSFYVPYFSETTEEGTNVLFSEGKEFRVEDGTVIMNFPIVKGPDGTPMELDVIPEHYFIFLERQYGAIQLGAG